MKKPPAPYSIDSLMDRYSELKPLIRNRLKEFTAVDPSEYFYELAYCLLTPQSSAINAGKAIKVLQERNFHRREFDPLTVLHQQEYYIRFHRTKAVRLVEMKQIFPVIKQQLSNGNRSAEIREWLVNNVKGLGWKEASHFLRNIGHRELAILDRHILKNLIRYNVVKELPKTLTTKEYMRIEQLFLQFSKRIGIPMDELDLLFWSMETGEILK